MSLLWKKETRHENALYVDIFWKLKPNIIYTMGGCAKTYCEMAEAMMESTVRSEKNNEKSRCYRKQGDAQFQQMKWLEAMKLYNRSLCMAKANSPNMGIAYAKRAQCFFQLKMYENCLLDLDLARFSNYPRKHYDLLSMREDECVRLMVENAAKPSMMPALSFKPDEKYPEMANVLKIENSSKGEWDVIATEDIAVGQVILIETSFVSSLTESYHKCGVCSTSLANLIPCNRCSKVLLCPTCHNTIIHRVECDAEVVFPGFYHEVSGTFRSILLAMTLFEDADKLIEFVEEIIAEGLTQIPETISDQKTKYRAFLHLAHDSTDLKDDAPLVFIHYATLMGHSTVRQYFTTEYHQRFLMHLIFHHLKVLKFHELNTAEIGIGDGVIKGVDHCLIIGTNFTHSCAPNATLKMVDGRAVMVTLRPIKKGQCVQISFNEQNILDKIEERQIKLEDHLDVPCPCERCVFERNPNKSRIDLHLILDPNFQFICDKMSSDEESEFLSDEWNELIKRAEAFLNMYGHLEWNDHLNSVFLLYFYMAKKQHDQFDFFAQLE